MQRSLFLLVIAFLALSCGKDASGIPDVPVSFHISLDNPAMQALNTPGGSVEIEGYGVAGLIIHRSAFQGYTAFDRCSSVNPEKKCKIKIDNTGLTATDPCSGAVFSLEDGTPQKAPATLPLKTYSVSISSGRMISVIN
jgi:nitrite reductase/ring-hydroxylating ferredoxin subunit